MDAQADTSSDRVIAGSGSREPGSPRSPRLGVPGDLRFAASRSDRFPASGARDPRRPRSREASMS